MAPPEVLEIRGVRVRKGDDDTRLLGLIIKKAKECGQMSWETGGTGKHFPCSLEKESCQHLDYPNEPNENSTVVKQ